MCDEELDGINGYFDDELFSRNAYSGFEKGLYLSISMRSEHPH